MTIAVLIITIVALLFAVAAIVFFKLRAPTAGAIFGTLALFLALADVKAFQFRKMGASPMTMPPTTVSSAVVKEEDWAPMLSAVGSISAVQGAIVSTELGGIVGEQLDQSGSEEKEGLLKLDSSSEEALLHTAEADLELARANLQRERDLAARKVVSKQELDAAESTFGQKQGTVDNMRAFIAKKQVHAPFDGQLGIRQVNVGQNHHIRIQSRSSGTRSRLCRFRVTAAGIVETRARIVVSARAHRCAAGPRIQRQIDGTQFNGRHGHAQRDFAGDVRKSG